MLRTVAAGHTLERLIWVEETRRVGLRWRVVGGLFGLLYRNRLLYWLASTIPFAGQWRVWQRLALPRLMGREVLEVGCGTGTLLGEMVAAGYSCAAIDRSPQMVAATRRELRRRGLSLAETPVRQASIQALPFADETFDDVVSTFPTEYIADLVGLREVARVLRPGGRLIVVLGAELLPEHLWLRPLVWLQRGVYGGRGAATCAGNSHVALPLARAGLVGRDECERGAFWLAHLVVAEKPR
jgi:SAM-dependent methyltransferase